MQFTRWLHISNPPRLRGTSHLLTHNAHVSCNATPHHTMHMRHASFPQSLRLHYNTNNLYISLCSSMPTKIKTIALLLESGHKHNELHAYSDFSSTANIVRKIILAWPPRSNDSRPNLLWAPQLTTSAPNKQGIVKHVTAKLFHTQAQH